VIDNLSDRRRPAFAGATIHRTHVTPYMTGGRMSAELRLL
jgi:hypothetical protein